ncbi:Hypoxia-responsive family protein [Quillaja saponaria]|uniref:Hypoxia-responsive family protein n=1 Tax=Quillaja saponaria TaxID=32244 RepID=A0AAD7LJZ1_QUISA|nr:Hypoxia-responsive family protein [Quillaja saponaria]
MEAIQSWVSEHKLASIGTLWASAIGASLAYSRTASPMKPSLRLIHARMHAQALTLAVLSGAAVYHCYENGGQTTDRESVADPNLTTVIDLAHEWELLSPF